MNKIASLNKNLTVNNEEVENMISELVEREEYACTGHGEAGKACGIN